MESSEFTMIDGRPVSSSTNTSDSETSPDGGSELDRRDDGVVEDDDCASAE
jgi:hypothetical protein